MYQQRLLLLPLLLPLLLTLLLPPPLLLLQHPLAPLFLLVLVSLAFETFDSVAVVV